MISLSICKCWRFWNPDLVFKNTGAMEEKASGHIVCDAVRDGVCKSTLCLCVKGMTSSVSKCVFLPFYKLT